MLVRAGSRFPAFPSGGMTLAPFDDPLHTMGAYTAGSLGCAGRPGRLGAARISRDHALNRPAAPGS